MSSSPPSRSHPPLGIAYDSDDDMNMDSDNELARAHDLDADGESIDEDSAPDQNGHSHLSDHRIPPPTGESVCFAPSSFMAVSCSPLHPS